MTTKIQIQPTDASIYLSILRHCFKYFKINGYLPDEIVLTPFLYLKLADIESRFNTNTHRTEFFLIKNKQIPIIVEEFDYGS